MLERPFMRHLEISQFFDFHDVSYLPCWIFEIEIFDSLAL